MTVSAPLDDKAFLLELMHHLAQQRIVALARRRQHLRQRGQAAQVRLEAGEVGPGHAAGEADLPAARSAERGEHLSPLRQAHVDARLFRERWIG